MFYAKKLNSNEKVWIILQVGKEWFVFDAVEAAGFLGKSCRQVLIENALLYFADGLETKILLDFLIMGMVK
jgi:hypothetical protein